MADRLAVESIVVRVRDGDQGYEITLDPREIQSFIFTNGRDPDLDGLLDKLDLRHKPIEELVSGQDCMKTIRHAEVRAGSPAATCWHCMDCTWYCPKPTRTELKHGA